MDSKSQRTMKAQNGFVLSLLYNCNGKKWMNDEMMQFCRRVHQLQQLLLKQIITAENLIHVILKNEIFR